MEPIVTAPVPRRFARALAALTLAGAIAAPLLAAAIWFFLPELMTLAGPRAPISPEAAPMGARLGCFVIALAGAGVQAWGLLSLRRMFLEAAEGRPLSFAAVKNFRRFAWITLILVPVAVAQHTAYLAILTAADPNQPGQLSISLGTNELKALFTAALFVFAAHVFAAGHAAEEENASFL